jgi:hypothetical protein
VVRERIIKLALDEPPLSPRELALRFTDTENCFVSEASVYRLLKAHDLIASPAFIVMKAGDEFKDKTPAPNQLGKSHEVDHVREFEDGSRIALEIEWNNKDPFYDRDLENFKRLHADGASSIGIIVTRGKSLHENMRKLVKRFLDERQI